MGKESMGNHYQIEKRKLVILQHLFDGVYYPVDICDPNGDSSHIQNPTCSDYYRDISPNGDITDSNYGNAPLPEYVRYNDAAGILHKVNEDLKEGWPLGVGMSMNTSGTKPLEYSTLNKTLKALTDNEHILDKTDGKNVKRKSFYFPKESIEGYNNFLSYISSIRYPPGDPMGDACHNLVFSHYSSIILNRDYVIKRLRQKEMTIYDADSGNQLPYLGRYKKLYEFPAPFEKLADILRKMESKIPDNDSDVWGLNSSSRDIALEILDIATEYRDEIDGINDALSDKPESEDPLSRLHPKDWFSLDPVTVLRSEAYWAPLELSDSDIPEILEVYSGFIWGKKWRGKNAILKDYIRRVEMDVLYKLCMMANSYSALISFHHYDSQRAYFQNMFHTNMITGVPQLPEYSDDVGIDSTLYRNAMYDYSIGRTERFSWGPRLMGIGPVLFEGNLVPCAFSFDLGPSSILTATWHNSKVLKQSDKNNHRSLLKNGVDIAIHGDHTRQSVLSNAFPNYLPAIIDMDEPKPIREVLYRLIWDIDPNGNCEHEADYYVDMFYDECHKHSPKRRG